MNPEDVLIIKITRAEVERLRREVAGASNRVEESDPDNNFFLSPAVDTLAEVLILLNTAELPTPESEEE